MDKMAWRLLALDVKISLRNFSGRLSRDKGGWRATLVLVLMGLAFLPLTFMLISTGVGTYLFLKLAGQPDATLTIFLVLGQFVALIFGFFYVLSTFYFSRDLRILVPLPIRPNSIVLAKFLRVVLTEYLTMGAVMLPALVTYGIDRGSALYWPVALLVFLLSPVLPLAIGGILVMVLMGATASRKVQLSRDSLRVVGALVAVAVMLFFQFKAKNEFRKDVQVPTGTKVTVHTGLNQQDNPFTKMLGENVDLIEQVGRYIPPSIWATQAMTAPTTGAGGLGLLGYIGVNGALVGLLLIGGSKLYFRGLLADEGGRPRKAATAGEVRAGATQVRSQFAALFWRELVLLVRTPMFLLNAALPLVIFPVMIGAGAMGSGSIAQVQTALSKPDSPFVRYLPVIVTAVMLFLAASTPLSSTAISREGRRLWISRMLPVDPGLQIGAKLALGMVHTVISAVLVGGIAVGLFGAPMTSVLLGVIGGLCTAALSHTLSIMIDLIRPSLNWTEPQAAMKGNINGLFGLLASFVEIIVLGGIGAVFAFFLPALTVPAISVVALAATYGMYRWTGQMASVRFREIEQ